MLDFIKEHPFLIAWCIFVFVVYIYACADYAYYRYDIKSKFMQERQFLYSQVIYQSLPIMLKNIFIQLKVGNL